MLSKASQYDDSLVMVRDEERPWASLIHLVGWVPIWGFVINAVIWLYYKNRSREVVFHVQQAVQFQIIVLLPVIGWGIFTIFNSVLLHLVPPVANVLQTLNHFLIVAVLTGAAAVGIWGAAMVYAGRPFLYPYFGRRVLEASIRKIDEE